VSIEVDISMNDFFETPWGTRGETGIARVKTRKGYMEYSYIVTHDPLKESAPGRWHRSAAGSMEWTPAGEHDMRWHISISAARDVPPWRCVVAIAHKLRPNVMFCVPLPPRSMWINMKPNCIHIWEVKDVNMTDQWAFEGRGDEPT
jgi:hypothetical protein